MIFTIVIGLLFLAIVFFHYLQGFFSSTLSAIVAVFAAVMAFSIHEYLVEKFLGGKVGNIGNGMVLVAMFALYYLVLRTITDKAVPGGVRLPAIIDRIGGALMGCVAAVFALGIFAIAAQELPFGASVLGYSKYETSDKDAQVMLGSQMQNGFMFDELKSDDAGRFDESTRQNMFPMIFGADEVVVKLVGHLSDNGALEGSQPLKAVHPDFLQEIFGQRIGIQSGTMHYAFDPADAREPSVKIEGIYSIKQVTPVDGEMYSVRRQPAKVTLKKISEYTVLVGLTNDKKPLNKNFEIDEASASHFLVGVRLSFGPNAADTIDSMVRFSPGSVRIVAKKADAAGNLQPVDYYPIGTLEPGKAAPTLFLNKPDDSLFVFMDKSKGRPAVDLVFLMDGNGFVSTTRKIQPGTFFEFKRLHRDDLSEKVLLTDLPPYTAGAFGVVHKNISKFDHNGAPPAEVIAIDNPAAPAPAAAPSAPAVSNGMFDATRVLISSAMEVHIGLTKTQAEKSSVLLPNLSGILADKKFQLIKIDPPAKVGDFGDNSVNIHEFSVPAGQSMVQVISDKPAKTWDWAQKVLVTTLSTSTGQQVKPVGLWALIGDKVYVRYAGDPAALDQDFVDPIPTSAGAPTRVGLLFLVPAGAKPNQLLIEGKAMQDLASKIQ